MNQLPFELKHLDHVVLRVRDSELMQDFYCAVLGCSLERSNHSVGLVQLRAGQSLIDLVDVEGSLGRAGGAAPGRSGRNVDHFCLRVEPFDRTLIVAHLNAAGVKIGDFGTRYGAEGAGPSQYLFDPEGNLVELKGPPDTRADDALST